MDVADVFWASSTDSNGDSGSEPDEAEPPGKGAVDLDENRGAGTPDAPVADADGEARRGRAAVESPTATEMASWPHLLEEAGFSRSEAARLIFERLRPREEGRART